MLTTSSVSVDCSSSLVCRITSVVVVRHTGNAKLKEKVPTAKSGLLERAGKADFYLEEFQPVSFGSWKLYPISTPGHTNGCTSFVLDDLSRVFTGDALFIRGCGRTDFQVCFLYLSNLVEISN